jgi:hypothetical protein
MKRIDLRFGAIVWLVAALSVLVVAAFERSISPLTATDNTLLGVVFGLGIPLCTYAIVGRITEYRRLLESTEALAKYGANRRVLALGFLTVGAVCSSVVGAALALLGVVAAHSAADSHFAFDALTSTGLGFLAGFVYCAWFAFGSTFGRRGRGRFVALALDWAIGSSTTAVALPVPRGHLRNLLGADPVLEMTQRQASLALILFGFVYLVFTLWRTPP